MIISGPPHVGPGSGWINQLRNEKYIEENGKLVLASVLGQRGHWLAAQCALHPGMGRVLSHLMVQSRSSAEFYILDDVAHLAGKKLQN